MEVTQEIEKKILEGSLKVSVDMSIDDKTAGNRIFARVIEKQGDTLLCEFESANFNLFNNEGKENV